MKKFLILAAVILLLTFLNFINESGTFYSLTKDELKLNKTLNTEKYREGILISEYDKVRSISSYIIDVELNPVNKEITASEEIIWVNKTEYSTNEIQFHLYPNAFKNQNTGFARGRNIILTNESESSIDIKALRVNNATAELTYFQPEIKNPYDSTVAKVLLTEEAAPGDTVRINIKYSMRVPKAMKRLGYAAGRNFFFLSQWFPKLGVFKDGKWICSQYHPFTNFYSDFGSYNVTITVPEQYTVASTGVLTDSSKAENKKTVTYKQYGVHDFAWMASDEIITQEDIYKRKDGSEVQVKLFIQPEKSKYAERYRNAVFNTLEYLEKNIGLYPYQTLTMVDVPRTSNSGGMEYPTLITVQADLFSPIETKKVEDITVHETVHQYFYGIAANNEVYEAWLDEGITTYISDKILEEYYGPPQISFNLFGQYPVLGMNFLSYNEIPLIYSLGEYYYGEGAAALSNYYRSPSVSSIADTSFLTPDYLNYGIAAYDKPQLMLISLERHIGKDRIMKILSDYFNSFKYSHASSGDFFSIVQNNTDKDLSWLMENVFYGTDVFDYKLEYVEPLDSVGYYEVMVRRIGDGISEQDIAFYSAKDTQYVKWDGKERWRKFIFYTNDEITGAEIDPQQKNILDIDFVNNSYLVNQQFGGSISISLKWFFWVQNLLLILGSVA